MVVNGIQKYHSVDGFQGPLQPLSGQRQNFAGDSADGAVRDGDAVDVLDMSLDIINSKGLGELPRGLHCYNIYVILRRIRNHYPMESIFI